MDGNELYHHGTKGQKWGVRRYQNSDGSLTEAGKNRYRRQEARQYKKKLNKLDKELRNSTIYGSNIHQYKNRYDKKIKKYDSKLNTTSNDKQKDKYIQKIQKAKNKSAKYEKALGIIDKHRNNSLAEMDKVIKELKDKDYSYSARPIEFSEFYSTRKLNKMLKDNGAKINRSLGRTNASSGNHFNVKDNKQISTRKRNSMSSKTSMNSYRPQTVVRVYY